MQRLQKKKKKQNNSGKKLVYRWNTIQKHPRLIRHTCLEDGKNETISTFYQMVLVHQAIPL